jgi:hypothetical protein
MSDTSGILTSSLVDQLASHWGGEPRVFKNALAEPLFSKDAFMEVVSTTAQKVIGEQLTGKPLLDEESPTAPIAHVFLDGRPLESITEAVPFVPQSGETLAEYEAKIRGAYPGREFSIILANCESVYAPIRNALCPSFHSLFSKVGYPARGNHACFYAGNYKKTPFKIHRDDAHILMFAGFGKKQMAFWPREHFDERQLFSETLSLTDALKSEATVCEIGPRDLLYWPPEYWHIGLSDNGEFHAALSMGIYHRGGSDEYLTRMRFWPEAEPTNKLADYDKLDLNGLVWKPGQSTIGDFPQALLDGLLAKWTSIQKCMTQEKELEYQLLRTILSIVSSAGFGPILNEQRAKVDDLSEQVELECRHPELIAYSRVSNRLVVGGNGSTFTYSKSLHDLEDVLAKLYSKKRVALSGASQDARRLLLDLASARAIDVILHRQV